MPLVAYLLLQITRVSKPLATPPTFTTKPLVNPKWTAVNDSDSQALPGNLVNRRLGLLIMRRSLLAQCGPRQSLGPRKLSENAGVAGTALRLFRPTCRITEKLTAWKCCATMVLTRIIHERNRILDNWICANDLATDSSLALCAGWHAPERSEGRGKA